MLLSIHYNFFASILIEIISTLFLIISEGIWEPQDPSLSFIRQGTVSSPLLSFPLHSSPILSYPILSSPFFSLLFSSFLIPAVTEYCVLPLSPTSITSPLLSKPISFSSFPTSKLLFYFQIQQPKNYI